MIPLKIRAGGWHFSHDFGTLLDHGQFLREFWVLV